MSSITVELVTGSKEVRDQFVDKVDVLDKVKQISALPDGHIETGEVASYYDIKRSTLSVLLSRHRNEFDGSELIQISGDELKKFKKDMSLQDTVISAKKSLNLYTRKGVLRVGMMLTESSVAEKVREYLLKIEENTTHQVRKTALDNTPKKVVTYEGEWTLEIDAYILSEVRKGYTEGRQLKEILVDVADQLGVKLPSVKSRWYTKVNGRPPLSQRFKGNYHRKNRGSKSNEVIAPPEQQELSLEPDGQESIQHPVSTEQLILEQMSLLAKSVNTLTNTVSGLQEQSQKVTEGMGTIWRAVEGIREQNESVSTGIDLILEEISSIRESVDYRNNKDIVGLNRKIKVISEKHKESQAQSEDLLRFIANSSILSDAFMEGVETVAAKAKLAIGKNGVVEAVK